MRGFILHINVYQNVCTMEETVNNKEKNGR